ncbi:hypothetical protein DWZ15_05625 [Collinsella sp. AF29-7AC]|nr:hypothetical protein DWZ15_05625 [Collinsella sp. AF29-7AC]
MVIVAGETVFAMDGAVLVVGETVFAMDGAVLLQNRRTVACQPAALVTFSLHLGKAPAPSRRCLVY